MSLACAAARGSVQVGSAWHVESTSEDFSRGAPQPRRYRPRHAAVRISLKPSPVSVWKFSLGRRGEHSAAARTLGLELRPNAAESDRKGRRKARRAVRSGRRRKL